MDSDHYYGRPPYTVTVSIKPVYTVGHKEERTYFYPSFRQKSKDFNVVFTVRFNNERHT